MKQEAANHHKLQSYPDNFIVVLKASRINLAQLYKSFVYNQVLAQLNKSFVYNQFFLLWNAFEKIIKSSVWLTTLWRIIQNFRSNNVNNSYLCLFSFKYEFNIIKKNCLCSRNDQHHILQLLMKRLKNWQ